VAARAIWKGVVKIGAQKLPVKLYSAVQDRTVHFRLLHKTDKQPVKQKLVSSGTGDVVDYGEVRKAYPLTRGRMVALEKEELAKLEPEDSRDIEVSRFVSPHEVDSRWYDRAYYLGPTTSDPTATRKPTSRSPPRWSEKANRASPAGPCARRSTSARWWPRMGI
jgi:DNA end-binding protein Ku